MDEPFVDFIFGSMNKYNRYINCTTCLSGKHIKHFNPLATLSCSPVVLILSFTDSLEYSFICDEA